MLSFLSSVPSVFVQKKKKIIITSFGKNRYENVYLHTNTREICDGNVQTIFRINTRHNILRRRLFVLKICKYHTIVCFQLDRLKVLPSCKRQNGPKTTTALVIFDPRNASARS